jgi:hypothetical protein
MVRQATEFLAAVIQYDPVRRSDARRKALELLDVSTDGLDGLCMVLDPRYWDGPSRADFVRRLRIGTSGARGVFPGSWRLSACDLLRRSVLRTREPITDDLRFLVRQIVDLAFNEDFSVANHAAYTVEAPPARHRLRRVVLTRRGAFLGPPIEPPPSKPF